MIDPTKRYSSYLIVPDYSYLEDEKPKHKAKEHAPEPTPEVSSAPEERNFTPTPLAGVNPSVWDDEYVRRPHIVPRDEIDASARENIERSVAPQGDLGVWNLEFAKDPDRESVHLDHNPYYLDSLDMYI